MEIEGKRGHLYVDHRTAEQWATCTRPSSHLKSLSQFSSGLGQSGRSYQRRPWFPVTLQTVRSNQRGLSPEMLSGPLPSGEPADVTHIHHRHCILYFKADR